jgi:hypothetical protein
VKSNPLSRFRASKRPTATACCYRCCCFLLLVMAGCNHHTNREIARSFYFWRTVFNLNEQDQRELKEQGVTRLYTRFFDVSFNPETALTCPVGDIRFAKAVDSSLQIIPVVFIVNDALVNTADSLIDKLGTQIAARIGSSFEMLKGQQLKEVQMDCDWTLLTRDRYFRLLRSIRKWFGPKVILSATIRLHQVKYADRTGIPPVDRGMLMFYNMGKLDDATAPNSIYDPRTASAYLVNFSSYPLALDIALPVFSWAVVFTNAGKVSKLVHEVEPEDMKAPGIEQLDATHYRVSAPVKLKDVELTRGETIRLECPGMEGSKRAAEQIARYLKEKKLTVALFHLKKNEYTSDEKQAFETVYHRFD